MENLERQSLEVDIACVGFGPAMGGFLTTLSKVADPSLLQSRVMPGMPLQIRCYERADDVGFGVSGVVTRGRGIRASFPELDLSSIPMAHPVKHEKLVYLLDPIGASRRSAALKLVDKLLPARHSAFEIPFIPAFLR